MSFFPTLYGFVVVVTNEKGEYLLLKRNSHKKLFPNKWAVVAAGPYLLPRKNIDALLKKS